LGEKPGAQSENACYGCHSKRDPKITERELRERVEQIQDRHRLLREQAMTALLGLISDLKSAREAGRSDVDLNTARYMQRRAQFYLDFVEAENSTGFHAPQEAARILAESLNYSRQGQLALRDKNFKPTIDVVNIPPPPDAAPKGK
jgi:nitrite reductase (cytochrome c-552)